MSKKDVKENKNKIIKNFQENDKYVAIHLTLTNNNVPLILKKDFSYDNDYIISKGKIFYPCSHIMRYELLTKQELEEERDYHSWR